ncbi:hypothetical protein CHU98_g11386 [Xylaria longipes]|nr:hypothetical protein CHU98_g11386 [Xylaria longipes]
MTRVDLRKRADPALAEELYSRAVVGNYTYSSVGTDPASCNATGWSSNMSPARCSSRDDIAVMDIKGNQPPTGHLRAACHAAPGQCNPLPVGVRMPTKGGRGVEYERLRGLHVTLYRMQTT